MSAFAPIPGGSQTGSLSHLRAEQITARLEDAQIATAHLNSLQEFWEHPQLQARQRWREVDSPVGQVRALLPPITMQNVEPRMGPIPAVGEHTVAILRALGYSEEKIERLRAERVI
jgi:itaconate CoA-transferase